MSQDTQPPRDEGSKEYSGCEEKKEASPRQKDEQLAPSPAKMDCASEPLSTPTEVTPSVASLWEEITWYPVLESDRKLSSSPRRRKKGPPPRKWMSLQGSVVPYEATQKKDGATSAALASPLFRNTAAFVAGEPIQAVPWTPSVALLRPQSNRNLTYNHVTLEAWQWPPSSTTEATSDPASKRTITVVPERIDPSLDLLQGSSVVRALLVGSLQKDSGNQKDGTPIGAGHLILRAKRQDANNHRRNSPRPQKVFSLRPGTMVTVPWETQQSTTYEIAMHPPTPSSDQTHESKDYVTLLLTFRQVVTNLIQNPERPPRVLGHWSTTIASSASPVNQPFLDDPQAEWKRISEAFAKEKRQEGLSYHVLYGPGSHLLPETRTQPCAAKVSWHDEDLRSLDTPRSSASTVTSVLSYSTPNRRNATSETPGSPPVRNIAVPRTAAAVALLVVDLQNDFLGDDPSFAFCSQYNNVCPFRTRRKALLQRIGELATQVRQQRGLVVFCRSVYGRWSKSQTKATEEANVSAGDDLSLDGISLTSSVITVKAGTHLDKDAVCSVGTKGSDFYPAAVDLMQDDDMVVTKHWYSAFLETSLHAQLQRLGVQTIVVSGVTTNHSVSATVRSASKLGYQVLLSSDGTAQIDPSLQPETEAKLQQYASILAPNTNLLDVLAPSAPVTPRTLGGRDEVNFDGWTRLSAMGAGDSFLLPDFFDPEQASTMLHSLPALLTDKTEKLPPHTAGRRTQNDSLRMVYQGTRNENGHMPYCRWGASEDAGFGTMPLNVTDWSKSLALALPEIETQAGHAFNFCRIAHHGSSKAKLRFRSELCLDMKEGSSVAIVALGEGLVLELRPKPGVSSSATPQKIYLRHNTLFLLGAETNRLFQYSIRCSRKVQRDQARFSLTFREMTTFRSGAKGIVYGPGTCFETMGDFHRGRQKESSVWLGAGVVACGASSLALSKRAQSNATESAVLMAAPLIGLVAMYQYWRHQRQKRSPREAARRLNQTMVRCNWQPLHFSEAKALLLEASNAELFGKPTHKHRITNV